MVGIAVMAQEELKEESRMVCRMNSRPNELNREGEMAQYTGLQSILNAALGEYQFKGFRLVEFGDHALNLYYQDEWVGVISQGSATIPVIHEACREHLEGIAG